MIISLDVGDRYIGIAATDRDKNLTYRYRTIDRAQKDVLSELALIVEKEKITTVLVGIPISLAGKQTEQTAKTKEFAQKLREKLAEHITVEEVDETLTSWEAQRNLAAEGANKADEHTEAARLMLVDYLTRAARRGV